MPPGVSYNTIYHIEADFQAYMMVHKMKTKA